MSNDCWVIKGWTTHHTMVLTWSMFGWRRFTCSKKWTEKKSLSESFEFNSRERGRERGNHGNQRFQMNRWSMSLCVCSWPALRHACYLYVLTALHLCARWFWIAGGYTGGQLVNLSNLPVCKSARKFDFVYQIVTHNCFGYNFILNLTIWFPNVFLHAINHLKTNGSAQTPLNKLKLNLAHRNRSWS